MSESASPPSNLNDLALKHGSDKWGVHYYTQHYQKFFDKFRDLPINLLEIGVGGYEREDAGGCSLRMWKEYFPNANIIALDFFNKKKIEEDRIKIYQGSQADIIILAEIIKDASDGFDVIIDDGSHVNEHVIKSFWCLWPHLKAGGIYIVEDVQTSYWANFGGDPYAVNSQNTSLSFFKALIDGLNWQERHVPTYSPSEFERTIVGLHFYHNMVFIEKGLNNEGSNLVKNNINPHVISELSVKTT